LKQKTEIKNSTLKLEFIFKICKTNRKLKTTTPIGDRDRIVSYIFPAN